MPEDAGYTRIGLTTGFRVQSSPPQIAQCRRQIDSVLSGSAKKNGFQAVFNPSYRVDITRRSHCPAVGACCAALTVTPGFLAVASCHRKRPGRRARKL
jgi:hypothetical protein